MKISSASGRRRRIAKAPSTSSSRITFDPLVEQAVDLRSEGAVAAAGERDVLLELVVVDAALELGVGEEEVLAPVDLARALRSRGRRDGDLCALGLPSQHAADERALAGAGRAGDDEQPRRERRREHPYRLSGRSTTSSPRWRSDRPPTVFDWLIRHWVSTRVALTRPSLGTASRMSKTFAVSRYSGGFQENIGDPTWPPRRSRFRRARASAPRSRAERLHPLIERAGRGLNVVVRRSPFRDGTRPGAPETTASGARSVRIRSENARPRVESRA